MFSEDMFAEDYNSQSRGLIQKQVQLQFWNNIKNFNTIKELSIVLVHVVSKFLYF